MTAPPTAPSAIPIPELNLPAPAVKLPEPSRLTMVDGVFKLVAALAAIAAVFTLTAVDPPTETTVAATEPEPDAVTSPVKAVMPVPAGVDQERFPEASVVRTWFADPYPSGHVNV